jgi:mRNA interferase RelE/StbE
MPDLGGISPRETFVKYHTVLSAKAMKSLDRLDKKTEQRVQNRLDELANNPIDPRISKHLETVEFRRYSRVGDWRLIFEIDEDNQRILIITIQHRSRVYKEVKK